LDSSPKIFNAHPADRLGAFDHALKSDMHKHILANNGDGFTIYGPYGITTIKPDRESVQEFIDLLNQYGLAEIPDESILDCCTSRKALEEGGGVKWEFKYTKMEDPITLGEWLGGINVIPIDVAQGKREQLVKTLNGTGTNGR
jgi:hypothetical protein